MKIKKNGLLIINLGTPEAPTPRAVRRYLREFLSDPKVIDLPWLIRQLLLNLVILPFRPKQTAVAYQAIWRHEGSPLLLYSKKLVQKLKQRLADKYQVTLAMRYGSPSIRLALKELKTCSSITVLPLFPQYAQATTGSIIDKVHAEAKALKLMTSIELYFIKDFYQQPQFVHILANQLKAIINPHTHILFSYHGLPERQIHKLGCKPVCLTACSKKTLEKNPDCYRAQCFQTTRLIVDQLRLNNSQYTTSFQSRLGRIPWIQPYTDEILQSLRDKQIENLVVICPSFVTDCLETLEEIGIQLKKQWLESGGKEFTLVPCLNDSQEWVQALSTIVLNHP